MTEYNLGEFKTLDNFTSFIQQIRSPQIREDTIVGKDYFSVPIFRACEQTRLFPAHIELIKEYSSPTMLWYMTERAGYNPSADVNGKFLNHAFWDGIFKSANFSVARQATDGKIPEVLRPVMTENVASLVASIETSAHNFRLFWGAVTPHVGNIPVDQMYKSPMEYIQEGYFKIPLRHEFEEHSREIRERILMNSHGELALLGLQKKMVPALIKVASRELDIPSEDIRNRASQKIRQWSESPWDVEGVELIGKIPTEKWIQASLESTPLYRRYLQAGSPPPRQIKRFPPMPPSSPPPEPTG